MVILTVVGLFGSASAQRVDGVNTGFGGGNTITGTVLTPTGERVDRHMSVRLSSMTKGDRVMATDDSGSFAFLGLPGGDYMVAIDKDKDFEPFRQTVTISNTPGGPAMSYPMFLRLKFKAGAAPPPVVNPEFAHVPPAAMVFYKKAVELAKAGDRKGAIEQLDLATKEHPKFAAAYNDMGVQYIQLKDLAKADDAFKSALNIDGKSFAPLLNHGMTLFDMKNYAESERVCRDVVKAQEKSAVGHYFLGQSLAYQGKFAESQKELVTAITLGGNAMADTLKEAHRLLAIVYSTQGNKKQQAAELEIYLKLAPNTPDAEQLRQLILKLKE